MPKGTSLDRQDGYNLAFSLKHFLFTKLKMIKLLLLIFINVVIIFIVIITTLNFYYYH